MRIKVSDIENNPFRHIDKYPINWDKVEALKISIEQTGFWDNILLRKTPNKKTYQIAYGHHRLIAVKELGKEYIDVPVRDLDDATMLRIMANENMDEWRASPAVINETVLAAKEFIDGELAKYETWEDLNKTIKILFDTEHSFIQTKTHGAGQTTILAFLGGNWKQWMIQEALATISADKEDKISREAVEVFDNQTKAQTFRRAVEEFEIPKTEQKEIADKIKKDGRDSVKEIKNAIQDIASDKGLKAFKEIFPAEVEEKPNLNTYLEKAIDHLIQINSVLGDILNHPDQVEKERMEYFVRLLTRTIKTINKKSEDLKCQKLLE